MGQKFFQILSARKFEPLTVTAVTDYARFSIVAVGMPEADRPPLLIRYGTGGAWSAYEIGTLISLNKGEKCQIRNQSEVFSRSLAKYLHFSCGYTNDRMALSGDLLALVNWRKDLPGYIFYRLFYNLKQLIEVPEIPDVPMEANAWSYSFAYCINLNKIRVNFKSWNGSATNNWILGISTSGTFYKPSALPEERGGSRIPNNWKVVNPDE